MAESSSSGYATVGYDTGGLITEPPNVVESLGIFAFLQWPHAWTLCAAISIAMGIAASKHLTVFIALFVITIFHYSKPAPPTTECYGEASARSRFLKRVIHVVCARTTREKLYS